MIRVDLIPEKDRRPRASLFGGPGDGPAREVIVGILVAVVGFFLALHLLVGLGMLWRMADHAALRMRWSSLGTERQKVDAVLDEQAVLDGKLLAVKPLMPAKPVSWTRFLNEVSDSVPQGVWLRGFVYDKDILMIYGSAVSKTKNEMVITGDFVAALKASSMVENFFGGIAVDAIQRREGFSVPVVDFALKAQRLIQVTTEGTKGKKKKKKKSRK
ncbi:MAG: PilN domain-containing protein [Elusimicrobia bacterium]|nr:PilN domain-containing protein [Elusimicrobiota bacterium]